MAVSDPYFPRHANSPTPGPLSPRTHLAEACSACDGLGSLSWSAHAPLRCAYCNGTGRVVRSTHSPGSEIR